MKLEGNPTSLLGPSSDPKSASKSLLELRLKGMARQQSAHQLRPRGENKRYRLQWPARWEKRKRLLWLMIACCNMGLSRPPCMLRVKKRIPVNGQPQAHKVLAWMRAAPSQVSRLRPPSTAESVMARRKGHSNAGQIKNCHPTCPTTAC